MSGPADDENDLLAAEYALGCLDAAEAASVEARAAHDIALRRSIEAWAARLAPLAATVPPRPPPASVWHRLAQAIGEAAPITAPPRIMPPPARTKLLNRLGFWRATTAAAMAAAAALAGIMVARAPQPSPPLGYMAALTPPGAPAPVFIARTQPDGWIQLVAVNPPPAPPARDMELWMLPPGQTRPTSLGVMPPDGKRFGPLSLPPDQTQLMISLEPPGGSPTGVPTGPVLFAGRLASMN